MNFDKLRTLGAKEALLVLGMFENDESSITRQEAAERMSTTIGSTDQILRRLVSKGWLSRAGSGVYTVLSAELGSAPTFEGEAYALLEASEPDAIVAYGTAASLLNLTTQLRHEVIVVSNKRQWTRDLGPVRLRRLKAGTILNEDVIEKNVRGVKVRLFGMERTAIDCIRHPEFCGGNDEARHILAAAARKWSWDKVRKLLDGKGKTAMRQRIGYLLDKSRSNMPDEFRSWMIDSIPKHSRAYLVPGQHGAYDKTWHVIA